MGGGGVQTKVFVHRNETLLDYFKIAIQFLTDGMNVAYRGNGHVEVGHMT